MFRAAPLVLLALVAAPAAAAGTDDRVQAIEQERAAAVARADAEAVAKLTRFAEAAARAGRAADARACWQAVLRIDPDHAAAKAALAAPDKPPADRRPGVGEADPRRTESTLPAALTADRTVGGPGAVVHVVGQLAVPTGVTLTVRPGTRLEAAPEAGLVVSGRLLAEGTETNPIAFVPANKRRGWAGIRIQAPGSTLAWCVIALAEKGLEIHKGGANVSHCALVGNRLGVWIHSTDTQISDTAVLYSLGHGINGFDESTPVARVTIKACRGVGYQCDHKSFPHISLCEITANQGGGFAGNTMSDRGIPEMRDSNVCGNAGFDIWCDQKDSYRFANVYVGKAAAARLAADPSAVVPNLRDARTTGEAGKGLVFLKPVATEPVAGAGAPKAVLDLAADYAKRLLSRR